jgi:hypothetical protein
MSDREAQESSSSSALRLRLENASAGLRFVSEMDHPFSWVSAADTAVDRPGPLERVRAAFGAEAHSHGEERSLDRFFAGHIEEADPADPAAQANVTRFERLKAVLREVLSDPRVYCFGGAEKRCLLVGGTPDGRIAGLETRIAET